MTLKGELGMVSQLLTIADEGQLLWAMNLASISSIFSSLHRVG